MPTRKPAPTQSIKDKEFPTLTEPTEIGNADALDVDALVVRTQQALDAGLTFPQGSIRGVYYPKLLEGLPFVITSSPVWRTQESNFKPGDTYDIACVHIRLFSHSDGTLSGSRMAHFSGGFLLNQIRSMTPHELVGSVLWTIARNPEQPEYANGHPYMLTPWDPSTADDQDDVFEAVPSRLAGLQALREKLTGGDAA